jgi:hypothetical protein
VFNSSGTIEFKSNGVDIMTVSDMHGLRVMPHGTNPGEAGSISLLEHENNGEHFVKLRAPDSLVASTHYTLPAADGTSGSFLHTDGSGSLSWQTPDTFDDTSVLLLKPTGVSSGQTGQVSLAELASSGTNTVTLRAPDNLVSNTVYTLPTATPVTSNQVLGSTPSGQTSWVHVSRIESATAASAVETTNSLTRISSDSTLIAAFDCLGPSRGLTMHSCEDSAGSGGSIELEEIPSHGSNTVSLKAPDNIPADYVLRLPSTPGGAGNRLTTDGSAGNLGWVPHNFYTTVTSWSAVTFSSNLNGGWFNSDQQVADLSPAQCTITETRIEDSVTQEFFCVKTITQTYSSTHASAGVMVPLPIDVTLFSNIYSGGGLWDTSGPGYERLKSVGTWASQEPNTPFRSQEGRLMPYATSSKAFVMFAKAASDAVITRLPVKFQEIQAMATVNARVSVRFTIKLS